MRALTFAMLCALAAPFAGAAAASLQPRIAMDERPYMLCREHTIRFGLLFKIAHVGLYLPDCAQAEDWLNAHDKVLRFHYLTDVKADVFKRSAHEYYLRNVPERVYLDSRNELLAFNGNYENVQADDVYDLWHRRDGHLWLMKNRRTLSRTDNSELASAYFNIWFGADPAVDKLKRALRP